MFSINTRTLKGLDDELGAREDKKIRPIGYDFFTNYLKCLKTLI